MSLPTASDSDDRTSDVSSIVIDLDRTLLATNLLHEAVIKAVRTDVRTLFRLPFWSRQGRSAFQAKIEERVEIDVSHLPYRRDVLDDIRKKKSEGCRIVLATSLPRSWASAVAAELDLFDDVVASDSPKNAESPRKLAALGSQRGDFGRALIEALRPHQWMKNTLVFIPLIAGRQLANPSKAMLSILAFVCYSACASSIYLANDLLDLDADRRHPKKSRRPFASGSLPVALGPPLSALLLLSAMALSLLAPDPLFPAILLLYVFLSTLYSSWLKTKPIVDVVLLAVLYTLRIFAGGAAAGIPISEWLTAFSMFMFLSIAFAKRHAELTRISIERHDSAAGRGYFASDLGLLESLGAASGYSAVLVLALYIHSPETRLIYRHPQTLWFVCPLLLYWIGRLWLFANRGKLDEDPLVFAMSDRVSLAVAALTAAIVAIS
jgi:4-hydroxybenzoate polyprenyltransferase